MDAEKAWNQFRTTGSVADYLLYRNAKNCTAKELSGPHMEETDEVQNRWSDITGTNNQGK